jgi:hypothetical protein
MTTPPALHSSKSQEHLTPADVVEAGRQTLGGFDLDPATTPFANELIQAGAIYTRAYDGITKPWFGRVWLNPPGGALRHECCGTKSEQALWWGRLASAWRSGEVEAAVFLGFSLELLQAAQGIEPAVPQPLDFPVCVPRKRIKFDQEVDGTRVSGDQPTHGNIVVLLPGPMDHDRIDQTDAFVREFSKLGYVNVNLGDRTIPTRQT